MGSCKFKTKYNIGDKVKTDKGRTFRILNFKIRTKMNQEHNYSELLYYVYCPECGYCQWVPSYALRHYNCHCQNGNYPWVQIGINDITTTDPWMIKYFPGGPQEAAKYRATSMTKVTLKCPHCGREKHDYQINYLHKLKNLPCTCNDHVSFPEKFITCFLEQLDVDYEYQVGKTRISFLDQASRGFKYDYYIPSLSCIIEAHGEQHYRDVKKWRGIEERKEWDKEKKELALNNDIKHYVELNCYYSQREWIKKSIMESDLPQILSFSEDDIDWLECEAFGSTNITKDICEYYMKTMANHSEMSKIFHMGDSAIGKNLKRGNDLGWCVYQPRKNYVDIIKAYNKDGETHLFKSSKDFDYNAKEILGIRNAPHLHHKYRDSGESCSGWFIETVTDPKEKFIAIYGDEAVKWFEEHPEFNN